MFISLRHRCSAWLTHWLIDLGVFVHMVFRNGPVAKSALWISRNSWITRAVPLPSTTRIDRRRKKSPKWEMWWKMSSKTAATATNIGKRWFDPIWTLQWFNWSRKWLRHWKKHWISNWASWLWSRKRGTGMTKRWWISETPVSRGDVARRFPDRKGWLGSNLI